MNYHYYGWHIRLPTSATPLQYEIAAVDAARLVQLDPSVIATLWNPYTCPKHLLPYLAWALSVDVWDTDWSEETKRDVIAASPMVHRLKGTRGSVERALAALGVDAQIVEWWETEPVGRRGTFDITAYANKQLDNGDVFLSRKLQEHVINQVRETKPKSRVFNFKIGAGYKNKAGVGTAFAALAINHETIKAGRNTCFSDQISAGNSLAALGIQHKTISANRKRPIQSRFGVGSAFSGLQIMHTVFATQEGFA